MFLPSSSVSRNRELKRQATGAEAVGAARVGIDGLPLREALLRSVGGRRRHLPLRVRLPAQRSGVNSNGVLTRRRWLGVDDIFLSAAVDDAAGIGVEVERTGGRDGGSEIVSGCLL